jgi:hypothetical protein
MNFEEIVKEWDKDCKIDETELGTESLKIPQLHNKYLKIYAGEKSRFLKVKADHSKFKRTLLEYYLGEMDKVQLQEFGREQIFKKILKNEVDTYIESDDAFIEQTLKLSAQQEKVAYIEAIIKSINTRGFSIKSAIEWLRFTNGSG